MSPAYRPSALLRDDPLAATEEAVETWARAQIEYRPVVGYKGEDSTCRDAVSAEHWDTATDMLERRVDDLVVRAVSGAIDSLSAPRRLVLWAVYCNRVGPAVWRSGALSEMTTPELVALHRGALGALRPMLRARGLVV